MCLGINSFVLSGKTFHISPIYRINKSKFTLLSGSDTLNTVTELVAQRFDKKKEEIDPNSDFYKVFVIIDLEFRSLGRIRWIKWSC